MRGKSGWDQVRVRKSTAIGHRDRDPYRFGPEKLISVKSENQNEADSQAREPQDE